VVSVHVGELGESLRQLVRLGLGETVVGGVEVVVNGVGVGAVLNGNKVVVGGGEVCDACVVAALSGGTEEIAKFFYLLFATKILKQNCFRALFYTRL